MTRHEAICQALHTAIAARVLALVGAGSLVIRSAPLEVLIDHLPRGVINLAEGETVEIDRTLGVHRRHHQLTIDAECAAAGKNPADRDALVDALMAAVGAAVAIDRTLGGLAQWCETAAPSAVENLALEGHADLKAAAVSIDILYSTGPDPLEAV